jgi:Zn ribbon nucleic-acid-binding protein
MRHPVECPRCSEIELLPTRTDNGIETWECPCGHEENMKGQWWQSLDDDNEAIEDFLT